MTWIVAGVLLAALAPAALAGWTGPEAFPDSAPRVAAAAPDGAMVEAWVAGGTVYGRHRDPEGSWGAVETVATGQGLATPVVAVGPDGRAALAWTGGSGFATTMTAALRSPGGEWTVTADVAGPALISVYDVAVSGQGDVYLTWSALQGGTFAYSLDGRAHLGDGWEAPVTLTTSGIGPQLAATDEGALLAWERDGGVEVSEVVDGVWGAALPLGGGANPSLAVGPDGTASMAWASSGDCCGVPGSVLAAVRPPGGAWPDGPEVVDGPDVLIPTTRPQVAVGPEGAVAVAYESDQGPGVVRVRVRTADGTWDATPTTLANGVFDPPSVVAEADGAFTVIRSFRSGTDRTAIANRRPAGGVWGPDVQIADAAPIAFAAVTAAVPLAGAGVYAAFWWNGSGSWVEDRIGPAASVRPEATGVPRQGETLTASPGEWTGTRPIALDVEWWRDGAAAGGWEQVGTGATRVLGAEDVGHQLEVRVTGSNAQGTGPVSASLPVSVLGPLPQATAPPVIAGVAMEDEILTASTGTWSGPDPVSFTFRWERDSGEGGAWEEVGSGPGYVLRAADTGRAVRVVVRASNIWGDAPPAASVPVGPVAARPPAPVGAPAPPPASTPDPAPPSGPARPAAPRVERLRPLCRSVPAGTAIRLTVTADDAEAVPVVIRREGSRRPARRLTRRVSDGRSRMALPTAGLAPGTYRVTVGARTVTVRITPRSASGGACGIG